MTTKKAGKGDIAAHAIADDTMSKVAAYLRRGRRFEALTPDELAIQYAEALQLWADNLYDPAAQALSDEVVAEYDLRGQEVPQGLAPEALERIVQAASKLLHCLPEDARATIEADLVRGFEDDTGKAN